MFIYDIAEFSDSQMCIRKKTIFTEIVNQKPHDNQKKNKHYDCHLYEEDQNSNVIKPIRSILRRRMKKRE